VICTDLGEAAPEDFILGTSEDDSLIQMSGPHNLKTFALGNGKHGLFFSGGFTFHLKMVK
jgi:hypothetical protein